MSAAVPSAEVQAELIVNGGFETPGGNGSTPTGWAEDGDAYGTYDGVFYSPSRTPPTHGGSWIATPGMGSSTTVGLYQTLGASLVAGEYKLEFWSTPWFSGNGNDVRVGKYSGSGTFDDVANWTSLALTSLTFPPSQQIAGNSVATHLRPSAGKTLFTSGRGSRGEATARISTTSV